ncbi:MAG: glucosyltransferase domain-containing protein [Eubacteriales bacterium]
MGQRFLSFYQNRIKQEYKLAFVSGLIVSLLIHLYKITNTLPNHDSVYNYYSDQNMLGSGRWALSLACGISSYYDLPWVNGLLSCIFIALTVVVIIALFKIRNPVLIILTGALLAASPATTETFFFLFTADGYMIAMFLAALAVYLSKIDEKRRICLFFSGVCICVSCGIYQAYVSFALILAVCYFINVLLQNHYSKKDCLKWVIKQVILYAASLAAYYVIWKGCLYFSGTVANHYQGISEVGRISADLFLHGAKNAVSSTLIFFLQWDVLEHGFTLYSILNLIFLAVMAVGLIVSCVKSGIFKRKWALILLILCLISIAPFACMWHFTSHSVGYRPMMIQSLTLLFVLTALLYENWAKPVLKETVCLLLVLITLNNAIMANISYFYMNQCYERTYAEGLEMMMKIHDFQDEYDFDKIAVVGTRIYEVQYEPVGSEDGKMQIPGRSYILIGKLEKSLLYDAEHTMRFLKATFGLDMESLDRSERNELLHTDKVRSMDCWPSRDSMAVIDDVLVIKLSDEEEFG